MKAAPFLCLGGTEVANGFRTATYVSNTGIPGVTMSQDCQCAQLDEGFTLPLGEAPWYESTRPESADFLGFWANTIQLGSVGARSSTSVGRTGARISPMSLNGRSIQVAGMMLASSAEGQAYGERWLAEVLRGSPCYEGDCANDDLVILPACPEEASYDDDRYFRTLVDVGMIEGPNFDQISELPDWYMQQASFVLASSQPWLYLPPDRCLDAEIIASYYGQQVSCALTTPQWMGEGTFRIEIENIGNADATDITIQGQISLDGSCPVSGDGTSVPPTFTYTIPTLKPEDKVIIDGMRRKVLYWDAANKYYTAGLPYLSFVGPFVFPDVRTCTTLCLSFDIATGEATATVDAVLREL